MFSKYKTVLFVSIVLMILITLGVSAFADEKYEDFMYVIDEYGAHITSYVGNSSVVTIPNEINQTPVVSFSLLNVDLSSEERENLKSVVKVIIPANVKKIDKSGLCEMINLRIIEGLEHIKILDDYAIHVSAVTELVFSDELEYIGKGAFEGSLVQFLTIPDDVECAYASINSAAMEKITLFRGKNAKKLQIVDNALLSIDGSRLLCYPTFCGTTSYTIPETVRTVDENAFESAGHLLLELVVPDTVETIGNFRVTPKLIMYVYSESPAFYFAQEKGREESSDWFEYIVLDSTTNIDYIQNRIERIVSEEISSNMNAWQKAKALHDWLIQNANYDYTFSHSTIADMLRYGTGICAAYADTYNALLKAAGVNCRVVGNFDHAFNAVQMDNGEWMYVDCTWDDMGEEPRYDYFGFERTIRTYTYGGDSPDDRNGMYIFLPTLNDSSAKWHYFVRTGLLTDTINSLKSKIQNHIDAEETEFHIGTEGIQTNLSTIENYLLCAAALSEENWRKENSDIDIHIKCNYVNELGFVCIIISGANNNINSFSYELYNNSIRITHYSGNEKVVEIPENISGYPVSYIGKKAFQNNTLIEEVRLPITMLEIGDNAFNSCVALKTINLNDSIIRIDDYAFIRCYHLENVVFSDALYHIGYDAFSECTSLTEVTIPSHCSEIVDGAFSQCSKLKTLIIEEGVTSIPSSCFSQCYSLKRVTFPKSLKSLGNCAFYRCVLLQSIEFPENLRYIGSAPFQECERLTELTIDSNNQYLIEIDNIVYSKDGKQVLMSLSSSPVVDLILPDGIEVINYRALYGLENLRSLYIPSSVKRLEQEAVSFCTHLTSVYMEDGCEYLARYAFSYNRINELRLANTISFMGDACFLGNDLRTIMIPNGITSILGNTFRGNPDLESVIIPASVTEIDNAAFDFAHEILVVKPDSYALTWAIDHGYVNSNDCTEHVPRYSVGKPKAIYIWSPDNTTVTGQYYSGDITGSIVIERVSASSSIVPPTSTTWGEAVYTSAAFENEAFTVQEKTVEIPALSLLHVLYLPNMLTVIDEMAFAGTSVQAIIIPNGCKSIGSKAFLNCSPFLYVLVPHSVEYIAEDAFEGCSDCVLDIR